MTSGGRSAPPAGGTPTGRRPAGWKAILAILSLAISLTLWLSGLLDSLSRPSVGGELNLRQLELAVMAAPRLPASLRPLLAGREPMVTLSDALAEQIRTAAEAGAPAAADLRLEQALLLQRLGRPGAAESLLADLAGQRGEPDAAAPDPSVALARRLLAKPGAKPASGGSAGSSPADILPADLLPADQGTSGTSWSGQRPLLRLLSCEALAGPATHGAADSDRCGALAAGRRAAMQLVAVTLLPAAVLLAGSALLLVEIWQGVRGRGLPLPPLEAPPLSGLDAVLLIAGGFVVIGELLTPMLVTPSLAALLQALAITSPLREGVSVVVFYGALMAGPLAILALMLRSLGPAPRDGWLLFRWRPLGPALKRALVSLLMVLPLVSLVGWVQGQLWSDPGGSNPLLNLVLRSQNGAALSCFALTAIVLAPLFEETIFRGVLLPVAARDLGAVRGVLISAAVFAVAHLSLGELLPLFVLGLGLGWLRLSGARLSSCVLMHALWNGLTFSNLVLLGN